MARVNSELVNASTPVAGEDGILLLSFAYDGGCRALQVSADGVKELWARRLLRIHHGNGVRIGGIVYGSSGDLGPAPLTAVDVKTGKVLWRERILSKSTILAVGGKLLALDEEGVLLLAQPGPGSGASPRKNAVDGRSLMDSSIACGRQAVRSQPHRHGSV